MKKKMFLTVAILLATTAMLFAQVQTEGDWQFTVSNNQVTITRYMNRTETTADIPARIRNLPVTTIGSGANMASVLPNRVTSVTIPPA
jgi:hypothetical protein